MGNYKGLFTFDVDNHRYIPIENADGIIEHYRNKPSFENKEKRNNNPRGWEICSQQKCSRLDYDGYKKQWTGIVIVTAPDIPGKYLGEYVVEQEEITLEFSTGLKDKNGKEIYAGDIVKCSYGGIGVVEFRHCAYFVVGDDISDMSNWKGTAYEVIGNIHENPELLEIKNEN